MIQGAEMLVSVITAGMPVRPVSGCRRTVRLVLRLPFRQWSEGVNRDGLREVRRWIDAVEGKLNRC